MATFFVTSLGSVAADIVIKSLKRLGHKVVGCDIYPKAWVPDAFNIDVFYQGVLASDTDAYLQFIEDICELEQVDYLIPLIDVEVDILNNNRELFESAGVVICISPSHALNVCRNKKKLKDFIDANCPEIRTIDTVMLSGCDASPWGYPVIVKPFDGRSSIGLRRVHDDLEWAALGNISDPERYIVQPYIEGSVVVTELVRHPLSDEVIVVAREELLDTLNFCGLVVRTFHDEVLEEQARHLAKELGISGCVNFEWKKDKDNHFHFIECNPRFSAGAEFTYMAGYDIVTNHLACFMEKDIERFQFRRGMIMSRKYEEYLTLVEN